MGVHGCSPRSGTLRPCCGVASEVDVNLEAVVGRLHLSLCACRIRALLPLQLPKSTTSSGVASQVAGAPIAAMLLSLNGVLGLRGWKWLFLLEGLPTIAFGFILKVSHPNCAIYPTSTPTPSLTQLTSILTLTCQGSSASRHIPH